MSAPRERRFALDGANPLLLNGSEALWLIEEGGVDVFSVRLENGVPAGAREHVCRIGSGQVVFGLGAAQAQASMGLIAIGLPGTRLRELAAPRERLLGSAPGGEALQPGEPAAAAWLDDWLRGLTRAFDEPAPRVFKRAEAPAPVAVEAGENVYALGRIAWVEPRQGPLAAERMPAAGPLPAGAPFPLTPSTWLRAAAAGELACRSSAQLIGANLALGALDAFHAVFLEDMLARSRRRDEARAARLEREQRRDARVFGQALSGLAAVVAEDDAAASRAADGADPLLDALQRVLAAGGLDIRLRGDPAQAAQPAGYIRFLARQARVGLRQVNLAGKPWWREDVGPLLAFRREDGAPLALLPSGEARYAAVDPVSGSRASVDAGVAATLADTAFMFFRSFPDRAVGLLDALRFGLVGTRRDALRLAVFGVLGGVLGLATPIATGFLIDSVIPSGQRPELVELVLLLLTSALGVAAFELSRGIAMLRVEARIDNASQAAIIHRLLELPAPFFRRYSAGDLALRAYGFDSILRVITSTTQSALFSWIFGLFSFAYLFYVSVTLALLASALVAVSIALTTGINLWRLRIERRMFALRGELASRVFQLLNGIAKLRANGAERRAFALWAEQYARQKRLDFTANRIGNYLSTFDAGYLVLASMLLFGVVALMHVGITTGSFLAFNAAFTQFFAATLAVSAALTGSLNAIPLYERAKPILQALPESVQGGNPPGELSGAIDIDHVSFRYLADGPLVLDDVSVRVAPGEFVAFVGPSGSGKSTLFRLLLGFERPEAGSVYYDARDLAGLDLGAVRRQLGVVLQSGRLMPGDIFTNIVGSSPHTLDDAWEAARMAGFDEDVKAMPMGMHTVISEGAGTLSGGQRQRLMIARALVRRPRILLFDEATSALDNATQAIVARSIERLNATRIVIAHRLSTIVRADRIFVIEAGRVVESGRYDELMARGGPFAELAKRQIA